MSVNKNAGRDLADYLRRRLEYIQRCNAEIESNLSDAEMALCRKIDDGEYSRHDPAVGQTIHHLECVVGNTFRYTMLVGVCSFLEEAMKAIAKLVVSDYEMKLRAQRKRRSDWLNKHLCLLTGSVGFNTAATQSDVDEFHNLIILRNCVVHAWGKVTNARDPRAVKTAVQHVETVEISKDGYLVLGDQVVPAGIIAAENIAESVLTSILQVSMT